MPKVVIISGTGGKAFCAGGDVVGVYKVWKEGKDSKSLSDFFAKEYILDY